MATSKITLYNIPELSDDKNYVIENAGNFLSHFAPQLTVEKFQYQRLEPTKRIKIAYTQALNSPSPAFLPNYCKIETTEDDGEATGLAPAYYFVVEVEQRARETVSLTLQLDVLNTFYDQFKQRMTPETYIARAHKDRFSKMRKFGNLYYLANSFDRVSEGDNMPLIENESERSTVYETEKGDSAGNPLKFYLVYRTDQDGRPCIDLAANRQITIGAGASGPTFSLLASQMPEGQYFYIIAENISFSVDGAESVFINAGGSSMWGGFFNKTRTYSGNGFLIFWKSLINGVPYICFEFVSDGDNVDAGNGEYYSIQNPMVGPNNGDYRFRGLKANNAEAQINILLGKTIYLSRTKTYDQELIKTFFNTTVNAGTYAPKTLGQIDLLDRTSQKIVKVIECPYCPVLISYDNATDVYKISQEYFPNESEEENPPFLRTYDLSKPFPKRRIGKVNWDSFLVQSSASLDPLSRPFLADPKIYTSPYFAITLLYDSFSLAVKLEDYEFNGSENFPVLGGLELLYKQSANVSSSLMFEAISPADIAPTFNWQYKLGKSEENYPRVLAASRNNEVALYSSEYLEYLKNGFNYDKKKREEGLAFSGAMAGLQTLGAVLSFALSGATGGATALAGTGLAIGAATTFANMGQKAYTSAEELNQKINLLKAQSYRVSSIDDLDLFNEYGKNKLSVLYYRVKDNDLNRIRARFQYFGYAVDEYGDPWPYMNSRHDFNYLKCDPVFDQPTPTAIPPEYLEAIADKLRAGITIFHERFYLYNGYKLDRNFENLEESVLAQLEN